jgi:hypothetical protein
LDISKGTCDEILALDKSIRLAGLSNLTFSKVAFKYRKGLKPLLNEEKTRRSLFQSVIRDGMSSTMEKELGEHQYTVTAYAKVKKVVVPFETEKTKERFILYLSLDRDARAGDIVKEKVMPLVTKLGGSFKGGQIGISE